MAHIKMIYGGHYLYDKRKLIGRVSPGNLEDIRAVILAERLSRAEEVARRRAERRRLEEQHARHGAVLAAIGSAFRQLKGIVMSAPGASKTAVQGGAIAPAKSTALAERVAPPPPPQPMMETLRYELSRMAGGSGGKPEDKAARRELLDELRAREREFAGPNPTPIEAALAESAALSWFMCRWLQVELNALVANRALNAGGIEAREKRLARAHKQFMETLALLDKIRKPSGPTVVNIASFGPRGKGPRRMTGRDTYVVDPIEDAGPDV